MDVSETVMSAISAAAGGATAAMIAAARRDPWYRRAHRLAARSDLALPEEFAGRIARFLRRQHLVLTFLAALSTATATAVIGASFDQPHTWAQLFPWIATALPALSAGMSWAWTRWPRWRPSGTLTYVRDLSVRQAFSVAECTVTWIGAAGAVIAGVSGLWLVTAPGWWWIAFAGSAGLAAGVWHSAVRSYLSRPTTASDGIERGWDDVIRFQQVRALTIGTAWAPAFLIFLADSAEAWRQDPSAVLWPLLLMTAVAAVAGRTYRQGSRLWREAGSATLRPPG